LHEEQRVKQDLFYVLLPAEIFPRIGRELARAFIASGWIK